MWEVLTFLLEGLIFIIIGLQLPQVVQALEPGALGRLLRISAFIVAAMIAARMLWIFPGAYIPRWIDRRLGRRTTPYPPWRHLVFGGWAGIRGGDSLVIALALPYTGLYGAPLPYRDAIIFIAFVVILITLVAQGLTLAPAIRILRIAGGDGEESEERHARRTSLRAAAAAIDRFAAEDAEELATATELRQLMASKLHELDGSGPTTSTHLRPRLVMLKAAREAVIDLRDRGEIGDAVMRQLQSEFDHEEVLLHQRL